MTVNNVSKTITQLNNFQSLKRMTYATVAKSNRTADNDFLRILLPSGRRNYFSG